MSLSTTHAYNKHCSMNSWNSDREALAAYHVPKQDELLFCTGGKEELRYTSAEFGD